MSAKDRNFRTEFYAKDRTRGLKRNAFIWEEIEWEMKDAIGECDGQRAIDNMKDILSHPLFISDPIPYPWVAEIRMRKHFPHLKDKTWVSPHPEAFHKLGYFQVWDGKNLQKEIFGTNKAREILNCEKKNDKGKEEIE